MQPELRQNKLCNHNVRKKTGEILSSWQMDIFRKGKVNIPRWKKYSQRSSACPPFLPTELMCVEGEGVGGSIDPFRRGGHYNDDPLGCVSTFCSSQTPR